MTSQQSAARETACSEHVVQLFDTLDSLVSAVVDFLDAGYRAGEYLFVAAKRAHWDRIAPALAARGCPVTEAFRGGRLVAFDAANVLRRIATNGMPDQDRFDAVVGAVVGEMAAKGPLRVYGEIVEVLAEEADFEAALRLERCWNDLAGKYPFRLMCGYSSAHFASRRGGAMLAGICATHTHVRAKRIDPLGEWLLAASGVRVGGAAGA